MMAYQLKHDSLPIQTCLVEFGIISIVLNALGKPSETQTLRQQG